MPDNTLAFFKSCTSLLKIFNNSATHENNIFIASVRWILPYVPVTSGIPPKMNWPVRKLLHNILCDSCVSSPRCGDQTEMRRSSSPPSGGSPELKIYMLSVVPSLLFSLYCLSCPCPRGTNLSTCSRLREALAFELRPCHLLLFESGEMRKDHWLGGICPSICRSSNHPQGQVSHCTVAPVHPASSPSGSPVKRC